MSQTEPVSLIHIGLPKTATTMLQRHLFAKHSQIYFLGISDVMGERYRRCRDAKTLSIMFDAVWKEPSKPNVELCRKRYQEIQCIASDNQQSPLFSLETLSLNTRGWREIRASNLRKILGRSKIVMAVRHPVELIRSVYSQYIKRELIFAAPGKAARLLDINQWINKGFKKSHTPPTCHLDYARTIQTYANQFGKKAVYVAVFEDLKEDSSNFIRNLCRFLDIDSQEGLDLTAQKSANVRLSSANMEALRSIRRSPLRAIRFRYSKPMQRMRMIGMSETDDVGDADKTAEQIDKDLIAAVEDMTREGNRLLVEEWGLALERHKYPL